VKRKKREQEEEMLKQFIQKQEEYLASHKDEIFKGVEEEE